MLAATLTACALQDYRAKPILPERVAAELRERSPDAPRLREFMVQHGLTPREWPLSEWGLRELTLAAFFFHPELDVARARFAEARAQQITVGAKPAPALEVLPEYVRSHDTKRPWALGFTFDLPWSSGQKRTARAEQARQLAESARLEIGVSAWRVRSGLRATLTDYWAAQQQLAAEDAQSQARGELLRLLEKRLTAGMASQVDLANARIARNDAQFRLIQAQGRMEAALPALAAAAGLPAARLQSIKLASATSTEPIAAQNLDVAALERTAFANRLDLRQQLTEYAAAEAALKLEVAKQYPDLQLKPGYTWDQGDSRFAFGVALNLPIPRANQGPIGEALARRATQARKFAALQSKIASEVEQAVTGYRVAQRELAEARKLTAAQHARANLVDKQFAHGSADRLDQAQARLELASVQGTEAAASIAVQHALGLLEDALQRPLDGGAELGIPYQEPKR